MLMSAGGLGFGWAITPETAEFKLVNIRAGLDLSIPIRTLPPETKIIVCVLMWVGRPGGEPEMWCPAAPPLPAEQAPPAVPTS
jgi:hypothetical protein